MTLSVVIPAFNSASTIVAAIGSARAAGADEVVVVDDGSEDDTAVRSREVGAVVVRQENAGAASARRRGVRVSTGLHVILLDADDRLSSDGIRASRQILESDDSIGLVAGATLGVGRAGVGRRLRGWPEGITVESLLKRGHAPGPPAAFVWRRSVLEHVLLDEPVGLWPRYAEDYEFLLRAALRTRVVHHDVESCVYAWVGGKSSKGPLNSIADAERIRLHYSSIAGVPVRPRTQREISRMVLMRRASERVDGGAISRLVLLARAGLTDPAFILDGIIRRASGS